MSLLLKTAALITVSILHPTAASGGRRQVQDRRQNCPCPKSLIFPPLPGKHPNLIHSSLKLAREIPPSRDKERSEKARHLLRNSANLTFKAGAQVLAPPRPAPVPVSSSFISSWSPTFQPPPLSKRCFPRAVSAALKVPDCLLFLNLKSNLKRIFRHSFSHLHRTFLIKIKQALVSRVFKGLRSKLRERKSIPPHHSTSSRAIVLPPSPRPGAGVSRFSSRIRDHHPARTPPPSLRVERKAPLPFRGCHGSGNAPSSSARSGCGGRGATGCRGSARVWRSAVFKGEPLPALPPASWVSPLAPQGAREAPAGAKPRLRSPLRASCAPSAGSGSALLGALQARRVVSPKREAPPPGLRAGTTCRRCHLCLVWGASSGGARARGGWEGGECGRCARERVCACVRARVCGGCERRGRRWRSLRPGSAPAGEGLQGLAPLELGICGRSLSILVES